MSDSESIGPFGNPDGARADLADVLSDFVDFDGDPAYGALSTRASDATVRVVVGKLGAGKTVYLRRLQEFQNRQDSVYADVPQQSLPATDEIVKACQWYTPDVLEGKWTLLWNRAILRALSSHLLRKAELAQHLPVGTAADIESNYAQLVGQFRRPHSIYAELREIINASRTGHELDRFLNLPLWNDLEDVLGEAMRHCPPIFFYLDGVDEEFSFAPMYWLQCQKGLFHQVMLLLRDPKLGGKLHVVVSIRDVVMSSILRSEHAPKYIGEPHIRLLTWDRDSLKVLLQRKLDMLDPSCFVADVAQGRSVKTWLGSSVFDNRSRNVSEDIVEYLLRHTRLIPRDIVSLGNALCAETRDRKRTGAGAIAPDRLRAVVSRSARRFGDSQLAQCSNQIASDMMPADAARHEYDNVYTTAGSYVRSIESDLRTMIQSVGVDRFSPAELASLRELADSLWAGSTDLPSVLWQNGLLGYRDRSGLATFYSLGDTDQFYLPEPADAFIFHPCLIDSVGISVADGGL